MQRCGCSRNCLLRACVVRSTTWVHMRQHDNNVAPETVVICDAELQQNSIWKQWQCVVHLYSCTFVLVYLCQLSCLIANIQLQLCHPALDGQVILQYVTE